MKRLWLMGLCLVGACALPASHLRDVAPVDSTGHGGSEFMQLALAAVIVLLLIPTLTKGKP